MKDHSVKSNTEIAISKIRDLIFAGKLNAGSNHLETELADLLGMSRTPVREAVLTLAAQGLLEVRPRKGVRISPISASDMAEIYDVLTELESLAAFNAAQQSYSSTDLAQLSTAIDKMDMALATDDRQAWADADEAFHTELVRLGQNSRVQMIVAMMSDQTRRARSVTLFMRPKPTKSNEDHRGVLDAISKGQPETARQLHSAHRRSAKEILIDLLDTHQLGSL